jgi:anti-anti-sigma factor
MNLSTEQNLGIAIVRVGESRMMYPLLADFSGAVMSLLNGGDKKVMIDLSKVTYVDSATIGCLMDLYRQTTAAGGELRLAGRIDRIDAVPGGREAIVYDYKGRSKPPSQARWLAEAKLQIGLYMLALPHLIGREAAGGLYQPLGAEDPRPRGLLREDADPSLDAVHTDRLPDDEFRARLDEVLAAALEAVRGIRAGALEPRPDTCAWNGGCAHPSICRCET